VSSWLSINVEPYTKAEEKEDEQKRRDLQANSSSDERFKRHF
jgi:hypothetical protein